MFAEEKPSLIPLPVEPFRYYQYGERTVHLDGCVEVKKLPTMARRPDESAEACSAMGLPSGPFARPTDRPTIA